MPVRPRKHRDMGVISTTVGLIHSQVGLLCTSITWPKLRNRCYYIIFFQTEGQHKLFHCGLKERRVFHNLTVVSLFVRKITQADFNIKYTCTKMSYKLDIHVLLYTSYCSEYYSEAC